jgi:hypothetical protein
MHTQIEFKFQFAKCRNISELLSFFKATIGFMSRFSIELPVEIKELVELFNTGGEKQDTMRFPVGRWH